MTANDLPIQLIEDPHAGVVGAAHDGATPEELRACFLSGQMPECDAVALGLEMAQPGQVIVVKNPQPAIDLLRELTEKMAKHRVGLATGVIGGRRVRLCGWYEQDLAPTLLRIKLYLEKQS